MPWVHLRAIPAVAAVPKVAVAGGRVVVGAAFHRLSWDLATPAAVATPGGDIPAAVAAILVGVGAIPEVDATPVAAVGTSATGPDLQAQLKSPGGQVETAC